MLAQLSLFDEITSAKPPADPAKARPLADLTRLAVTLPPGDPETKPKPATEGEPKRQRKKGGYYVPAKPQAWVLRVGGLSAAALVVADRLWQLRGLKKTNVVRLSVPGPWKAVLPRWKVQRGLVALERAGLVTVESKQGARPLVTLLIDEGGKPLANC
jgi:hypothetical protein